MQKHLAYNPKILSEFNSIISIFYNIFGNFSFNKYRKFFLVKNKLKINKFFENSQQFVVNLVAHIYNEEKGLNQLSRYFLDLTVLLCSNLNIKFRRVMVDNSRTTVNIMDFKIENILSEINDISQKFKTEDNSVLVVPIDFCLLYNISDYLILIFNHTNRQFDLPHLWESKNISLNTVIGENERKRIQNQKEAMVNILKEYNIQQESDLFNFNKNFIKKNLRRIIKAIKRGEDKILIDKIFSIIITKNNNFEKDDKNYWYTNFIEEIFCGAIMPFPFRESNLKLLKLLLEKNVLIIIEVRKEPFNSLIRSLKIFKVHAHHSIYHGKLISKLGNISIANTIHLKYSAAQLVALLPKSLKSLRNSDKLYGSFHITMI